MFLEPVKRPNWELTNQIYNNSLTKDAIEHFGLSDGAIAFYLYDVTSKNGPVSFIGRKARRGLSLTKMEPKAEIRCNVFLNFRLFCHIPPEMVVDHINAIEIACFFRIREPRDLYDFANIRPGYPPQINCPRDYHFADYDLPPSEANIYRRKLAIAFNNDYWQKTTLFWELLRQVDKFEKKNK